MFRKLKRGATKEVSNEVDKENLPKHIAIIMDGNGRWAVSRNLPRISGHKAGVEAVREVIRYSSDIGIQFLTLYAFSTENWNRPVSEVNGLMELLVLYLKKEIGELSRNNVKINVMGDISKLPKKAVLEIEKAVTSTSNNTGLTVNIALNYGSRSEILKAAKKLCQSVKSSSIDIKDIDENLFSQYLYTKNIPDPDILIRTSGEQRISNFLLWQIAYSELLFIEVYWPDFKSEHLMEAIIDFQSRQRRFGGL